MDLLKRRQLCRRFQRKHYLYHARSRHDDHGSLELYWRQRKYKGSWRRQPKHDNRPTSNGRQHPYCVLGFHAVILPCSLYCIDNHLEAAKGPRRIDAAYTTLIRLLRGAGNKRPRPAFLSTSAPDASREKGRVRRFLAAPIRRA